MMYLYYSLLFLFAFFCLICYLIAIKYKRDFDKIVKENFEDHYRWETRIRKKEIRIIELNKKIIQLEKEIHRKDSEIQLLNYIIKY